MKDKNKINKQIAGKLEECDKQLADAKLQEAERKQTHEELEALLNIVERGKQEWEVTVDSISQLICLLDSEGKILRTNLTLEKWGIGQVKDVKGKRMHELFHPGCSDPGCYMETYWHNVWQEVGRGRQAEFEAEDRLLKRFLRVQALPMIHRHGKSKAAAAFSVVIIHDISERKEAEEELGRAYQEVELLANLVENAHEMIFVLKSEGRIMKSNSLARRIFGYSQSEILSQNVMNLFRFETGGDWKTIAGSVDLESHWRGDLRAVCRDGREFPVDMTISRPAEGRGAGRSENMICFVRDVTEEKEVDRMKSEFISTVSHELRTPLSITREGISLVLDKIPGSINEKQEELLSTAMTNIDRLARIIDDLLDISKIEAGRIDLNRRQVDLQCLINNVISSFEAKAKNKGIGIRVFFPRKKIYIYSDEDKIVQVFTNLIGNSIKFTEKGCIEISIKEKKDKVECTLTDTGIGISKGDLPMLFNRFQQFGRTAGPGDKGTGLGLSIVKSLVEMHGGEVKVDSTVNKGTIFTFTLPIYTPWNILKEDVQSSIKEADAKKSSFSLLAVNINNFNEVSKKTGKEKAGGIFGELVEIFKKPLRRTCKIIVEDYSNIYILLPDTQKDGASIVLDRLKQVFKDYISVKGINELKGLKTRLTGCTYPEEADSYEDLIKKTQRGRSGRENSTYRG